MAEVRRLITYAEGEEGALRPAEKRKRGVVIDDLFGLTDDGYVVHIPTGRNIGPGRTKEGAERLIQDDRKFVEWLRSSDPEGWESSRNYKFGQPLAPALKERLQHTRDSYPGD